MLTMACGPKFIVATSSVQTSGRSSSTCRTRASGVAMLVPGPPRAGSASSGTKRAPGPVVRLMMTSLPASRIRATTSRYSARSRLGLPVAGSRTWICAMAAPASRAASTSAAIRSGVTGMAGFWCALSAPPVTAQLMMTGRVTASFLPSAWVAAIRRSCGHREPP
jgi:hypothetical protein